MHLTALMFSDPAEHCHELTSITHTQTKCILPSIKSLELNLHFIMIHHTGRPAYSRDSSDRCGKSRKIIKLKIPFAIKTGRY